jgi:hypothetical protein
LAQKYNNDNNEKSAKDRKPFITVGGAGFFI